MHTTMISIRDWALRQWNRCVFVLRYVGDFFARLWTFWGPRLTDRAFVAGLVMNSAMLVGAHHAPEFLNWLTVAIWVAANFFFPVWDTLPNERLRVSRLNAPSGFALGEGGAASRNGLGAPFPAR